MKKALKRTAYIIGAIAVTGGGVLVYAQFNQSAPEYSSIVVEASEFIQSVEETGVIDTNVSITYGWETSGRVVEVSKEVGDTVSTTDIIAKLNNTNEINALRQAQSQYAAASARLSEAISEPTEAEQDTYRARIAQAKASLAQSETDLHNTKLTVAANIENAKRAIEQAKNQLQETDTTNQQVRNAYDDLVNTMEQLSPDIRDARVEADNILGVENTFANDDFEDVLGVQNSSFLNKAKQQFNIAFANEQQTTAQLHHIDSADDAAIDTVALSVQNTLRSMNTLLQDVLNVLDATSAIGDLTQTELTALQNGVIAEKTSITGGLSTITNAMQAVKTAKNSAESSQITLADAEAALDTTTRTGEQQIASAERTVEIRAAGVQEAEANFAVLVSPPRDVDVAALRADISRYASGIAAAQKKVDDMVLRALTNGTLTMMSVSVGETVSPNQDIVTIQSDDRKIEVDISESDVASISVGDTAVVELDAYDDVQLEAMVVKINPAATEISGVVYYKTTLSIIVPEELDVRPGMTADVQIITEQRSETIAIPRRALLQEDGTKVRVLTDASTAAFDLRSVEVGMTGDDGVVEIISGLSVGEEIITFIE